MLESRKLTEASSFADAADTWAQSRGLITGGGTSTLLPEIIGMPDGSTDLGAFNIGIIAVNRTIKQALQDLENGVNTRMSAGNNLSDLTNKGQARTNLELGTAATWNIGSAGAVIPLLNGVNTWSAKQTFSATLAATGSAEVTGNPGAESNYLFTVGGAKRWSILRNNTAESGSNAGSDFVIARYDDAGLLIENAFAINRSNGNITLGKPLPVASGGTGATSLVTLKQSLSLNNVDNTSDINKPVSTATQTALSTKLDKDGGAIVNNLTVGGYVRAGTQLLVNGNSTEGGQIILGYRNVTGLTGQANGTWNVDVDGNNALRIFVQRADGSSPTPYMTITEAGLISLQNLTVSGGGTAFKIVGSGGANQGMAIQNLSVSASSAGTEFIDFTNENGFGVANVSVAINTNGSSKLGFAVTAAGSRSADRRVEVMSLDSAVASFTVPINGRAYPRRSDGADFNFVWTGQTSAPSWILGSNNGTEVYPFNPTNVSVGKLSGIDGGNAGGYIRRSTDTAGNGSLSNQLIVSGDTATNDVWSNPIQIREVNLVAGAQTASTYAPGITFHWSGRAASAIKMHGDGSIRFQQQNTTLTYQTIYTGDNYSAGWYRLTNDNGLYWEARNRGLAGADTGSVYGHVTTTGAGRNGWSGYSIGSWASFMADGTECGIYSQQYGNWLMRFDASRNAIFAQNVTAYSDERLKQNRREIDNVAARRKGMAAAAIKYERDGVTKIGFGAQTLELTVPEVVFTLDDLMHTKTVSYAELTAILAVDNQMLSEQVEKLETAVEDLQTLCADLVARLEKAGL